MIADKGRKFLGDVVIHAVVARPWVLCRVNIKPRSFAKIIGFIWIIGNVIATRAGIRGDNGNAKFACHVKSPGLLHEVFIGAG